MSFIITTSKFYLHKQHDGTGATLSKCINRATGTFLAGSLALGVQWIACKSGETFKPIIIGISVFILGGYFI